MSSPSAFSSKGLSLKISVPLVQGDDVVGEYSKDVNSYTHTLSADDGYSSASFSIPGNNELLESWLQSGLGRHIEVFGPSMETIWEGFVNEVSVNFGSAKFTKGPLVNIANRVVVWYTPYYDDCPPVGSPQYDAACINDGAPNTGVPMPTVEVEDEDSQKKYGIWEKVVNVGECYYYEADYIRDLYLLENSHPEWNPSLSISDSSSEMSVEIKCKGYIEWLNNYVYNNLEEQTYVYISELIKTILGDDPNDIFSTNYSMINENLRIHGTQFMDEKLAKTIIDDLLTFGGGNDDRWTFGIYKNRMAHYAAIPNEVEYIYYKTGNTQEIETITGHKVNPWNVLPCKWAAIPTFLASFPFKVNNIREDPRIFFVEEVIYTAPDQVSLTGAKIRKLPQYLASLGLSGV